MSRELRITKVLGEAPQSCRGVLQQAFSGSASPRKAIKGFCLACTGYDREAVKNCTSGACPLWMYRPFQDKPNANVTPAALPGVANADL